MSIGIFGDSFATSHMQSRHFAWYNILAKKLGTKIYNYEIDEENTYGLGASSTFYSYKKFIKYHHKHEYNIFIASYAQKYTKLINFYDDDDALYPLSGINTLDWYLNDPKLPNTSRELLEKIRCWFLVNDEEFMNVAQELMLQDIETKGGKKTIIITADIDESFCEKRKEKSPINFGLWDLAKLMWIELGISHKESERYVQNEKLDKIACHMTETTNHILADIIYDHIKTNKRMTLPNRIPHEHTWEYYYE